MMLRQILHDDLACASYLVADGGVAAVVDPQWDVREYLRLARLHRLRIADVIDTHVHADHLSGRARLAAATGAQVRMPAGSGAADPHEPLGDGDVVRVGSIELRALATPGHRPEHLALLLADHVELWPGHVGGSLCGGSALSGRTVSTLGHERRTNRALGISEPDDFVAALSTGLPPRPPTAVRLVQLNRNPPHGAGGPRPRLDARTVRRLLEDGTILVDGRPGADFDRAHAPGSVSLDGARPGVGTRAGRALDPDLPVIVSAETPAAAERLASALELARAAPARGVCPPAGESWESTAIPEIRAQAHRVAAIVTGARAAVAA